MAKQTKKDFIYAVGRRRSSTARVRLFKGENENTVNGIVIGKYFDTPFMNEVWQKPFKVTESMGNFYMTAKVEGGGKVGQLDAVVHAIARALSQSNETEYKPLLRKAGLLTRDSRIRERRKVGTGGKARHKKQSPKR